MKVYVTIERSVRYGKEAKPVQTAFGAELTSVGSGVAGVWLDLYARLSSAG